MRVLKVVGVTAFLLVILGSSILSLYWSSATHREVLGLCKSIEILGGYLAPLQPCVIIKDFGRIGRGETDGTGSIFGGETTETTQGRFQIILRPGVARDTWLLDTQSGEVWNIYEDTTTKRASWGLMNKSELQPASEQ